MYAAILILMTYYPVFVIKTVIRTGIVCSCNKPSHFVLVEIDHAGVAVVVLVVDIVGTGFAVCGFLFVHDDSPCM